MIEMVLDAPLRLAVFVLAVFVPLLSCFLAREIFSEDTERMEQ